MTAAFMNMRENNPALKDLTMEQWIDFVDYTREGTFPRPSDAPHE